MSLRFRNTTAQRAQLRLRQGALRGVWTAGAGGTIQCEPESEYVAHLAADLGGLRYELPVRPQPPWPRLVVVRRFGEGQLPFDVLQEESGAEATLEIENTLPVRLSVRLARAMPPLSAVAVLEQWERRAFALADALEARAVVDGFVTDAVACAGLAHTLEAALERKGGRPLLRLLS